MSTLLFISSPTAARSTNWASRPSWAPAASSAAAKLLLLGNESQTVGPEDAPREVHLLLLGAGTALLEGVVLDGVPEGRYLLNAAPLNLGGCDGAPCRAWLMTAEEARAV